MNRMKTLGAVSMLALAALTSGCFSSRTPDEMRVVRKAPLTVPPDYNLRPPAPGEARPQELLPDAQARVAVFGVDLGNNSTQGEQLFVKAAGADTTDRSVRNQVDFEAAQILRKNRGFADAIMFWNKKKPVEPQVDAAAEAQRLQAEDESVKAVTGGKPVLIRKKKSTKLPGL